MIYRISHVYMGKFTHGKVLDLSGSADCRSLIYDDADKNRRYTPRLLVTIQFNYNLIVLHIINIIEEIK